jgi:hypothetical protein
MNQKYRAALGDGNQMMRLKNFMETCQKLLEGEGQTESAFYFEQLSEYFAKGGELIDDRKETSRILGL